MELGIRKGKKILKDKPSSNGFETTDSELIVSRKFIDHVVICCIKDWIKREPKSREHIYFELNENARLLKADLIVIPDYFNTQKHVLAECYRFYDRRNYQS